jgi:hypothetical protein
MASLTRRRNRDGSASWDATVRVVGYPTACKTFSTKLEADLWASRIEAAARGRTLTLARGLTLAQLIDEALPKVDRPVSAAFMATRVRTCVPNLQYLQRLNRVVQPQRYRRRPFIDPHKIVVARRELHTPSVSAAVSGDTMDARARPR